MFTQGLQTQKLPQTSLSQGFSLGIKYSPCSLLYAGRILAFHNPGSGLLWAPRARGAASLVWVIVAGLYDRATLHPPQGSDLLRYHSALSPHLVDIIPPLIYTQVDIKSGLVGSDDKPILL